MKNKEEGGQMGKDEFAILFGDLPTILFRSYIPH